jgi:hypothetical protein
MKALGRFFSGIFSSVAKSESENIHYRWGIERNKAAQFGPSHVAEIDAIFSRQS